MDLAVCLTSLEPLILDRIYLAWYGTPNSYLQEIILGIPLASEHHVCESSVGWPVLYPLLRLFSKQTHTLIDIPEEPVS